MTPLFDLNSPALPAAFADAFLSDRVASSGPSYHVVRGGSGPAVLLIPGWPQSWLSWRLVMPALLAAGHTVVAVDPKGVGLSDRPESDPAGAGYDTATAASELREVMGSLGHERFDVVGHDVGAWIAYALAFEHPDAISSLTVVDATIPGSQPSPPLFLPQQLNDVAWHFVFNRVAAEIQVPLLSGGGARAYLDWQFATKAAPGFRFDEAVLAQYRAANSDDDGPLHHALNYYRAIDETIAQNQARTERLTLPVLAVGGQFSAGPIIEGAMRLVADDVTGVVVPGSGHFVPEEGSGALVAELTAFLARS